MRYSATCLKEKGFKYWKLILKKVLELDKWHLPMSNPIDSCSGMFREPKGSSLQTRQLAAHHQSLS
jgi:hypothetical protein